ncbi:uncharacterized protein JN550_000171 [Neoarthrinium moseri]|uniref:uncharacterized protein n=1 Tax=Neoarthrinium moseri TaxID=1658444 RepID=UPI001FDE2F07|nr:uncharacterized protein JN550_000171 [Neoarthrinium moseri]KAI1877989.1 hypothetical protein JN550_000171 [Neoarthrinium moseri]
MPAPQDYGGDYRRGHQWTHFELNAVLALICKRDHLRLSPLDFTTKLNETLNGEGGGLSRSAYDRDIPVADVKALLHHIKTEKKGALAFIERQPAPHVLTRAKKRAFERSMAFDGSKEEWETGRKEQVMAKKEARQAPSDGQQTIFTNNQGVQIERWAPVGPNGVPDLRYHGRMDITGTGIADQPFSNRTNSQASHAVSMSTASRNGSFGQALSRPGAHAFGSAATPLTPGWGAPLSTVPTTGTTSTNPQGTPWLEYDDVQAKIDSITSAAAQAPSAHQTRGSSGWGQENMAPDRSRPPPPPSFEQANARPWQSQPPRYRDQVRRSQ